MNGMFFTFEISRPFQWRPGFWRCAGITTWRVWWGWFAVSCHPMRYDEMIALAESGSVKWITEAKECAALARVDGEK